MPSTPTEAVLDVNGIIAAVFEDHVRHAKARRFFHTNWTGTGGRVSSSTYTV